MKDYYAHRCMSKSEYSQFYANNPKRTKKYGNKIIKRCLQTLGVRFDQTGNVIKDRIHSTIIQQYIKNPTN